jgi:putative two-component system response regulator
MALTDMPHGVAVGIIAEGRGTHFDPDVTDAFLVLADQFHSIALLCADSEKDMVHEAVTLKTFVG